MVKKDQSRTPSSRPFTEGPWEVQTHYGDERFKDEDSDSTYCIVKPEGGSFPEDSICEVWGTEHDDEANARLIAAAPDLLAACEEFVRKVDSGEARSKRSYAEMKRAIKKARGK